MEHDSPEFPAARSRPGSVRVAGGKKGDTKVILAVLLSIAASTAVHAQTEYFPQHTDALWTYGGSPREIARSLTMRLDDADAGVYAWDGPFGTQSVVLTEDGLLEEVTDTGRRTLLDFAAPAGGSWVIADVGTDDLVTNSTVTVADRTMSKTVSFGTFENVIHFRLTPPSGLADAGVTDLWFAPKVGLIAFEEITIAGAQTYELAAMAIPGDAVEFPLPAPEPVDPDDRFPASIGLTWTYAGPLDDTRMIRIIDTGVAGSEQALLMTGLMGDRLVRANGNRIEQFSSDAWRLLFDLDAEAGASWTIDLESAQLDDFLDGAAVTVVARSDSITVPYGTFGGITHLSIAPPPGLADAGLTDLWLAPGVGIVAWTELSIAGPRTYSLVSFANRFEPRPLPRPEPLPDPLIPIDNFRNTANRVQDGVFYAVGSTESTVEQGGVVMIHYYAVAQEGEHVFRFNSTQQVEFVLRDEEGGEVWAWSRGRGFGDALTAFTLTEGDSVRFVDRLDLRTEAVPPGGYTLVGFLPTDPNGEPTVSAAATEVGVALTVVGEPTFGTLEGVVKDAEGAPVPEVVVSVNPDRPPEAGGVFFPAIASFTDREGRFRVGRLRPGGYRVTTSKRGYASATERIDVTAGVNRVTVTLTAREDDGFVNAHAVSNDLMTVEVATDRVRYAVGDTLKMRYTATNVSGRDLPMRFPSGQNFDVVVSGEQGVVWTWSATRLFPQVIRDTVFVEGDTFTFEVTEPIPPSWAPHAGGMQIEAYLALFDLAEEGGLNRGLTRGYVKFALVGEGGRPAPFPGKPGQVAVSLKLDKESYASTDTAVASYTLRNVSEDSLTLFFPSGQRYDLSLTEGRSGERLWTWSMNKLFTQAATTLGVAAGESFTFSEPIPLSEASGTDGVRILEAFLTISDASSDVRVEDTRAARRFWVGERTPGEQPPSASRVRRSLHLAAGSDSVTASYVVRNVGGKDIPAVFSSGQTFEMVLSRGDQEVWRWSEGKAFTLAIRETNFAAGDSIVVSTRFAMPEAAGAYTVVAYLALTDAPDGALTLEETRVRQRLTVTDDGTSPGGSETMVRRSDFDSSGEVDFGDFISFAVAFGTRQGDFAFDASFDLDEDGQVGFSDFISFASAFGSRVTAE